MFIGCHRNYVGHLYYAETNSSLNLLEFTEIDLGLKKRPEGITHDYKTKEVYVTEWKHGIRKVNLDTMTNETVIQGGKCHGVQGRREGFWRKCTNMRVSSQVKTTSTAP